MLTEKARYELSHGDYDTVFESTKAQKYHNQ